MNTSAFPSTQFTVGAGISTGLTIGAASRVSQVEDQLNSLKVLSGDLASMVATFQQRLSGVTSQGNKKLAEVEPMPRELLVPLAEQMRVVADSINSSINALRELNGAIELPG
jgi:hypothetical protein